MRHFSILFIFIFTCFKAVAQTTDIAILRDINVHRNENLKDVMVFMNNSDYYLAGTATAFQFFAAYYYPDKVSPKDGLQSLIGFGYATVITYCYKYTLLRDRPYVSYSGLKNYDKATDPSFPSGHTSIAFSTATTLSICYPKWYIIAPAYLWAGTVGYSQMYLGMHYPTDVLFGAAFGAASSWLSLKTTDYLQRRKGRNSLIVE